MRQYTCLFFDLDKTLWDFESNSKVTLKEMYDLFSLKVYVGDFYSFYRNYREVNDRLWHQYRNDEITKHELRWKRFYLTLETFDISDRKLADELDEYYITNSPLKNKMFPNTLETISELKNKEYRMFILTNGFTEVQYVKLDSCGLSGMFERVFTSEEVGVQKPGKAFFEFVLNSINVAPDKCLMIGDDCLSDIEGAKGCGIDQVFFNPEKVRNGCESTYEIADMKELLKILD